MVPIVAEFESSIHLNGDLWQIVKRSSEDLSLSSLSSPDAKLVRDTLLNFRREGADLSPSDGQRLQQINSAISKATQEFRDRCVASRDSFSLCVDNESDLSGIPAAAVADAKRTAAAKGDPDKWRFTLDFPSSSSVLRFADSEVLRKAMWEAVTSIGTGAYDTEPIIWELLKLRSEKAKLLGFANVADYTCARRMSKTGHAALAFIEDLRDRIDGRFREEDEALRRFFAAKTGREALMPWDRPYWSVKQQTELFQFDSESLRPFFPVDAVLDGLFRITSAIFGISVRERPTFFGTVAVEGAVEVYHPDVRFFEIFDAESGEFMGGVFADLYARECKQGGAWADYVDVRGMAFLATNFQGPASSAFLNHDEVLTLFHEFGHTCHILLCKSRYCGFSAYDTPWDFVELPSQFLENFGWEQSALSLFTSVPDDLFQRLKETRLFHVATQAMRQLQFGKFDLEVHINYEKYVGRKIDELDRELLERYRVQQPVYAPSFGRSFIHIFGSPTNYYAAGYYSYKWAEVLDADVFEKFREDGVISAKVGMRFRKEVLEKGASEDVDALFRNFMGRDPDPTAFLVRSGIISVQS
jgi:oligopeptidase A